MMIVDEWFSTLSDQIRALESAAHDLHARPRTLRESAREALDRIFSCRAPSVPLLFDASEEYERLKQILADLLKICIGFIKHPYFQSDSSEANRLGLIFTILRKQSTLDRKRRQAVRIADQLRDVSFLTSLPAQERARLHSANDGLVWYALKGVVVDRLPYGSSELDCAVQRACVNLLDTMYTMWRITEA